MPVPLHHADRHNVFGTLGMFERQPVDVMRVVVLGERAGLRRPAAFAPRNDFHELVLPRPLAGHLLEDGLAVHQRAAVGDMRPLLLRQSDLSARRVGEGDVRGVVPGAGTARINSSRGLAGGDEHHRDQKDEGFHA
jgi:hypothetical protein